MTEGIPDSVTLIFDGTCDFCTRCTRYVRAIDRHHRVTAFPFQKPGIPETYGLTIADCEAAAWAISSGMSAQPGAAAVMLTLSVALGSRLPWLIYRIPGLRQLQDALYAMVARHRHRLPGATPYCEQHPEECSTPRSPDLK
jgi:predicted DCC family thiol-disulfide oxidoreductase YuxK